jgi:hypothetical protein
MAFWAAIKRIVFSHYFMPAVLLLVAFVVWAQAISLDEIANFIIFKTASDRLMQQQNLYDFIQYRYIWDKFFYTPAFAALFIPFALLPLKFSVLCWLLISVACYYFSLRMLPLDHRQKTIIFLIALLDLINSLQNLQTNALNAGFMLVIAACLYRQKSARAGLATSLCLCIKIYPAAAAILLFLCPKKFPFLLWCAFFSTFIFLLPLAVVPAGYYLESMQMWFKTLAADTDVMEIYKSPSLVGINYTWFPQTLNHFYLQIGGLILTLIPLLKADKKNHDKHFLLLYLAFLMIFVVIFNHAAESPTYVIAVTGAAIWYAVSEKSTLNNVLLVLLFVACILTPTDLFPGWLRKEYLAPLKIRVIPCLLIWIKIFYQLLTRKTESVTAIHAE